jgi:hypothetical protein
MLHLARLPARGKTENFCARGTVHVDKKKSTPGGRDTKSWDMVLKKMVLSRN